MKTSTAVRAAWLAVWGVCLMVQMTWAQSADQDDPSPHSEAQLVGEVESVQPGEPFTVALRMEMDSGWHSYWRNPGDSGEPTSIDWQMPDGFEADSIDWPYPHRIEAGPFVSYGYSDQVFLLTDIHPPASLEPGSTVRLTAKATWLICADVCLPAEQNVALSLPVRTGEPGSAQWHEQISDARSRLPETAERWNVEAFRSSGSYTLKVTPPNDWTRDLDNAYFFSAKKAVVEHAAPQPVSKEGNSYLIALQQSEYAQEPADRLRGVLVTDRNSDADDARAIRVDVPVAEEYAAGAAASGTSASSMTLVWALLFAFAGGMILNLMPCVFPVLSVKMLSLTEQASGADKSIRTHGLVFGLGILVSMWLLAGILLALRAGGTEIGWGFQLQSPVFVGLLVLLFFAIGLSLMGVFEVGSGLMSWGSRMQGSTGGSGYTGSFLTGVLTTVVATPCTAPFMGAALGFAITLSVVDALLVFTLLGAGIAAPYVALSMAPRLLRRLPEPGAWMETLKQVLAFPMFATSIWLIWVFGQQAGVTGTAYLLLGLLLLSLGAWIMNRWSLAQISTKTRIVTRALAVIAVAGAVVCSVAGAASEMSLEANASTTTDARWQAFSPDKVEQFRSEGRAVFVDFTAAWCLTCQVNERTVLNTSSVQEAFDEKNVALIKADWTNRDKEITTALEEYGRSGVPLYVLYKGDGSDPMVLPEVLTQSIVLDALDQIPAAAGASAQTGRETAEDLHRRSS